MVEENARYHQVDEFLLAARRAQGSTKYQRMTRALDLVMSLGTQLCSGRVNEWGLRLSRPRKADVVSEIESRAENAELCVIGEYDCVSIPQGAAKAETKSRSMPNMWLKQRDLHTMSGPFEDHAAVQWRCRSRPEYGVSYSTSLSLST